ncbi:MAG: hypothetical protein RBQ99_02875 [Trichlorobacter sp.]|nr:hypothetical protein [Trichlorobacter sp.]
MGAQYQVIGGTLRTILRMSNLLQGLCLLAMLVLWLGTLHPSALPVVLAAYIWLSALILWRQSMLFAETSYPACLSGQGWPFAGFNRTDGKPAVFAYPQVSDTERLLADLEKVPATKLQSSKLRGLRYLQKKGLSMPEPSPDQAFCRLIGAGWREINLYSPIAIIATGLALLSSVITHIK